MENNELKKKVCIENHIYYFNMIKLEDFDLDNILIDKKSHEHILIYDIPFKTLTDSKPLHVRFNKIDVIIKIYERSEYLTLFGTKKYDAIYDKIRYLKYKKGHHIYYFSLFRKSQS